MPEQMRAVTSPLTRPGVRRVADAVLMVAAVAVCLSYLWAVWHGFALDLAVYRGGGRAAFSGRHLYDTPMVSGYYFTYPPIAALLFVPWAHFPWRASEVLWTLLSLLVLWYVVRLTLRRYGQVTLGDLRTWTLVVFVLVAASDPLRVGLGLGQINVLIALLVLADFSGVLPRVPRGVFIGVAAAIKLTPLFLIAYLLVVRRIRDAVWAAGTFLVLCLVTFAVMPAASADYWWSGRVSDLSRFGVGYVSNQSVNGFVVRLLDYPDHGRLWWLVAALPVALLVLWTARVTVGDRPWLAESVAMAGAVAISPISWIHHWILVLPLLVASVRLGAEPRYRAVRWLALVLAAVLLLRVIWWVTHTYRSSPWQFALGSADIGLLVLLLVAIAWQVGAVPRRESRSRRAMDARPT